MMSSRRHRESPNRGAHRFAIAAVSVVIALVLIASATVASAGTKTLRAYTKPWDTRTFTSVSVVTYAKQVTAPGFRSRRVRNYGGGRYGWVLWGGTIDRYSPLTITMYHPTGTAGGAISGYDYKRNGRVRWVGLCHDPISYHIEEGGATGATYLGYPIPPGQCGYFYQMWLTADAEDTVVSAQFDLGPESGAYNFQVLDNSFPTLPDPGFDLGDLEIPLLEMPDGYIYEIIDYMEPADATGLPGEVTQWAYDSLTGLATLDFGASGGLRPGQTGSIVAFTAAASPALVKWNNVEVEYADAEFPACNQEVVTSLPVPTIDPCLIIETAHALNGQDVTVSITTEQSIYEMGGFDFLIRYDDSHLAFKEAGAGDLLEDCGWEYFTYRHGVEGNCGDACPKGLMRIIAMADLDNGPTQHPSCYGPPDTDPHELATMKFSVSGDRNIIDQCLPIEWYWDDCPDNIITIPDGTMSYVDLTVYSAAGDLIWDEDDDDTYPEDARPPHVGTPDVCMEGGGPDKPAPVRRLCFRNGAICVDEPPDDRGDINLNGIANEVSDAVLFSHYFIYGPSVWDPIYQDAQILATDINDDGIVLTVADLIYLIRIITGDEQPYPAGENPKVAEAPLTATIDWSVEDGALRVGWNCAVETGALLIVLEHDGAHFGAPIAGVHAEGLTVLSHDTGTQLRMLLVGMDRGAAIVSGEGPIVSIPLSGSPSVTLADVEAVDYDGTPITVTSGKSAHVPHSFTLNQNVPNPFNAGTRFTFFIPEDGEATLEVFDILGRRVALVFHEYVAAGTHHVAWDARTETGDELASGIYLYRLTTTVGHLTRKMVLLR